MREEDLELRHVFRLPPNIYDQFETAEVGQLKRQIEMLMSDRAYGEQIKALYSRPSFRWLAQFANWPE
ncbi:MAG: hypothetical protein M3Z96_14145 [Pseudomonadota bacterium]|nr:hypothetical protein [Pseudomonadota bacterium]